MTNLITINETNPVVELATIIHFSENTEDSVQRLIRENEEELDSLIESQRINPTLPRGKSGKQIEWSNVRLNEKQVYFVLTLLQNTANVKKFKLELIKQFFAMRDEISQIREKATREAFEKDKTLAIEALIEEKRLALEDARRLNDYDGFITITKYIQEYNSEKYDKDLIYDALTWKGLNRNETIQTVYRRLPENIDDYMGRTISGTKGTPIYPPAVIDGVIKQYLVAIEPENPIALN